MNCRPIFLVMTFSWATLVASIATGQNNQPDAASKPNILVIFGDDIGQSNISAYTHGLVGYKTPNIDRLAREGMLFTDYYAENSCTAGRSTFITGSLACAPASARLDSPAPLSVCKKEISPLPRRSSPWDTPQANSEKIIWATATSIYRPHTVSTSSSGTSIT